MSLIVSTRGLSKRYGRDYRVKNVNLEVKEGEIYSFLGPNGAGKSTTLKMLLGLTQPTEGEVTIFGQSFEKNRSRILSMTGSLIESPSYYGHLSGLENMRVVQRLRGVSDRNVQEALRIVRLEGQRDKKASQYSLGMKQRLGIAMALMAFPKLLILDEPTNGLDPAGIGEIRELIQSLPERYGMTVLISSHLLSEMEQVATSTGIIHNGELIFQGRMEELRGRSRPLILIRTGSNPSARDLLKSEGYAVSLQEEALVLEGLRDEQIAGVNRRLVAAGIDVFRMEERQNNLETIFLDMTGKGRSL